MQQQDALQEERAKREALQAQADNLALALVEQKRAAERMEADLVVANQLAQKLYDENVDLAHKVVNSEGLVQKLVAAGIEQQQQMATKDEHIARHKFCKTHRYFWRACNVFRHSKARGGYSRYGRQGNEGRQRYRGVHSDGGRSNRRSAG